MHTLRTRVSAGLVILVAATVLAVTADAAHADPTVGHCTMTNGELDYSPALTVVPKSETVTLNSTGSNCVGVYTFIAGNGEAVTVNYIALTGTFTGTGSTTLSQYSGSGSITYGLAGGGTRTETFTASCPVGAAAVCPLLGTDTDGSTMEITPTPVNVNPLGPVSSLPFVELAFTMANLQAIIA